jgi:hypothetical protein
MGHTKKILKLKIKKSLKEQVEVGSYFLIWSTLTKITYKTLFTSMKLALRVCYLLIAQKVRQFKIFILQL